MYKFWQTQIFDELQNQTEFEIEFVDDLPNFEILGKQENTVVVINDFMTEASGNNQVQGLFTRGCHMNFSVIFLAQNLFHQGKHSRSMSLNTDYMILLKIVRDKSQIRHLARQMYPLNPKFIYSAYQDATKAPMDICF